MNSALRNRQLLLHPYILGELTLGIGFVHARVLADLNDLRRATLATPEDVLAMIERDGLATCGIGYVDAHLLASAKLEREGVIWTRDNRLAAAARRLGVDETRR